MGKEFVQKGSRIYNVALSPYNQFLAIADDYKVRLLNAASGKECFAASQAAACAIAFDPTSKFVAIGGEEGVIRALKIPDGDELFNIKCTSQIFRPGQVTLIEFSRDGRSMAISDRGEIIIWDVINLQQRFEIGANRIEKLRFSDDGNRLTGWNGLYDGCKEMVWNVKTGERISVSKYEHLAIRPRTPDGLFMLVDNLDHAQLFSRRRHEYWWGLAWLPEFWTTLILALAFLWSLRHDWRELKNRLPSHKIGY